MGFTLEKVVPWGRSYDEYVDMFDLSTADLGLRILGCGDGPAGFNATLTPQGGTVVSFDPLYAFDAGQIKARIAATFSTVMAEMERNQADYVWEQVASVRELGRLRMEAMRIFLDDFEAGRKEGRYIAGELPAFPFAGGSFDLALCSHFLLLYSDHLSAQFHRQAIEAMLRVAREVRIFPVLTLDGRPSPHLEGIIEYFSGLHYGVGLRRVGYEFQRGGNTMLQIQQAQGNVPA